MYFIAGNTFVNKWFYKLSINDFTCCRSSPPHPCYWITISALSTMSERGSFLWFELLSSLSWLEFVLSSWVYGHTWSAFLSFFLPRISCHNNHILHWHVLFYAFPASFEIWTWNWLVRAFSNYAHEHSVTVLLVHHSDVIYQISFHNCSVRTFFTVELSFICLVLIMQIFMLD